MVNEKTTQLCQTYLRFSYSVQQDLIKILMKYTTRKHEQGSTDATLAAADCSALLGRIISSIRVKLPPPNMAVSKAQFDEIKSYCESLDGLMNEICSEELIPTPDITFDSVMKMIKANIKSKLAREYIKSVGSHQVFEIPELSEFDDKEVHDLGQQFINILKGIKDHYKAFNKVIKDDDDGGFGGGGSSGGGDDSGWGSDNDNDAQDDSGSEAQSFDEGDNNNDAEESGDASNGGADAALDKLDKLAGQ